MITFNFNELSDLLTIKYNVDFKSYNKEFIILKSLTDLTENNNIIITENNKKVSMEFKNLKIQLINNIIDYIAKVEYLKEKSKQNNVVYKEKNIEYLWTEEIGKEVGQVLKREIRKYWFWF